MKRIIAITAFIVALSSCQQVHPRFNGFFDASDKTISINAQSNAYFAAELKDRLRQYGWDVRISGISGKDGEKIYTNVHTRYSLSLEEKNEGSNINLLPIFGLVGYIISGGGSDLSGGLVAHHSDISATIYENKTGVEIMYLADKYVNSRKGAQELAAQIEWHTRMRPTAKKQNR